MKRVLLTGVLAFGLAAFASQETSEAPTNSLASAESKAWSAAFSTDAVSDYVSRGQLCCDTPVYQNSLTLSYSFNEFGAVHANIWTCHGLTHKAKPRKSLATQEIDYTLSYTVDLSPFSFSLGTLWFTYPNQPYGSTEELFASISLPNDYVTPSFIAYWDYLDTYGNRPTAVYCEAALFHAFTLLPNLTLTPAFTLGLANAAYHDCYSNGAVNKTELTGGTAALTLVYKLSENITLSTYLKYTFAPSHTLRHHHPGYEKNQILYGGFSIALAF